MTAKKSKSKGEIKITKNGPYLISGGVPIAEQIIRVDSEGECHGWREGKKYPTQEGCALCRCGRSRNKPFCDSAHAKTHFDGTETASKEPYLKRARQIVGPNLKLTDVKDLCAEARFCQRAGGTWDLTMQSSEPQARQTAIEEACDCPSGRLMAWDEEGKAIEPDFEPSIGLVKDPEAKGNGPIWVRGGIPIQSADGTSYEVRNRVTLCCCGKSKNKPFCDGSHMKK